jgi:coenzyme PQQ precursor peptide PqqA
VQKSVKWRSCPGGGSARCADHQLDCVSTAGKSLAGSEKQMEELRMTWKTPKIVELVLGAEINSYACAELS